MRKTAIVAAAFAVAVGSICALWFAGRPAYRHHREARAVLQAREFLAKGDYRSASVSARQALLLNPTNVQAMLVMAQLCEMSRAPQVLDWRKRVAEIAPTVENKLLLASTALRWQGPPYPLAAQTLEDLSQGSNNASFHVVSAELALKLKRPAEAESRFEDAARLEPTNQLHQLNLAVLRLGATNQTRAAEARLILERFAADAKLAAIALRWLVADSLNRKDITSASQWSQRLLGDKSCTLDDRLQHLQILHRANDVDFPGFLATVQAMALTNAGAIYSVSSWMLAHSLTNQVWAFLSNCPPQLQSEQPFPLAKVDYFLAIKDGAGLEQFLLGEKWGDLEFLRQAFLSRAAQEQRDMLSADARWRLAVRQAGDRLGPLTSLLTLAGAWRREEGREEVLWQVIQKFPRERWAYRELDRLYATAGNTRGLNRLYSAVASSNPKDWVARNNFAATALLLRLNLSKAHETARDLYAQHAIEPVIASTYAWSLYLQGRTNEALGVIEQIKPEALEQPSVALYYGLLLAAVDQTNKASRYLQLGQAGQLLPEEKELAGRAQSPH